MTIREHLCALLFPRVRCLGCDEPREIDPGQPLCDACRMELEGLRLLDQVCPHCLSAMRHGEPCRYCAEGGMLGLSVAYAPYRYHGVSQRLTVMLKFNGVYLAAQPLVEGMLDAFPGWPVDAMVPIPLHKKRLRERGFNQAELLCDMLTPRTGVPTLNALERVKATRRQSSLPHDKRPGNVKDSFQSVLPVQGLTLLLVDDVRTTGSTAREAARVLLQSGAKEVLLLTAAVASAYPS